MRRKQEKNKSFQYLCLSLVATLMCGCSATKYLPEDSYLLDEVKVVTVGKYRDVSTSQLKSYVRQKPNAKWFSTVKLPLGVYAMAGKDSTWLNRTLQQMGEAPVVYDSVQAQMTCRDLQQALHNKGYLDAQVELFTDVNKRKIEAVYVLHPGKPYSLRELDFEIEDSTIVNLLKKRQWILHSGMQFTVESLNAERNQITQFLQNNGYFRFHKEFITYVAQKDEEQHGVNLKLRLSQQHKAYTIGNITHEGGQDDDINLHLRQSVLVENTFLEPGENYSAAKLQNTYNHFGRLGAVRYTNISFEPSPDTTVLDARIQVLTNKPSTISFQPEGTNTAGDFGAAASLTYQNRNLFRGSETFSLQLRGAFEAIKGLEGYSNNNFTEYSIESRLSFPRFIIPFLSRSFRRNTLATSDLSVIYDSQDRPEFHRRVLTAGWSYQWKPQNRHDSYRFDLVNLNYVFMPWISDTFRKEYLDNTSNQNVILRYNYEDLLIMRTGFGFQYNNGHIALRSNLETAGNLLGVCSELFGGQKNSLGQSELFNIAFAQYVKWDVDYTQELYKGANDQLVFHVGLGLAYPYGNSQVLPFEKRYFSGGANSVRGWSVRSLGPGRYKDKDGRVNFITMTGDVKLDMNVEYRIKLFWKFNGAIFADAGNIWTLRDYQDQPGGQFKFSRLLNDLAVSYGAGLRLNFDYFILRFDLGMKAVNPAYEIDDDAHYPLIHPKFSRDMAFHFAVGLPF